jgi:hypothetical protein
MQHCSVRDTLPPAALTPGRCISAGRLFKHPAMSLASFWTAGPYGHGMQSLTGYSYVVLREQRRGSTVAGPLKRHPDVGRIPGWFLVIPCFRKSTHQLLGANLPTGAAKIWKKHNPNGKVSGEVPGGFWKHPPCRLERFNSG